MNMTVEMLRVSALGGFGGWRVRDFSTWNRPAITATKRFGGVVVRFQGETADDIWGFIKAVEREVNP